MSLTDMNHTELVIYSIRWLGTFFNWALVFLLFYMRSKGEKAPMTLSQRWALTILLWLFLLNSLTLVREHLTTYLSDTGDANILYLIGRINGTLDIMIGMTLLMFGLVFPRPYTKWETLQKYILLVIGAMVFMVFSQEAGMRSSTDLRSITFMGGFAYTIGWFVPVIIWLGHYEKEPSPQSRMVLSLFMWGFLIAPFPGSLSSWMLLFSGFKNINIINAATILNFCLFLYAFARMLLILWRTRGSWTDAEWIHVGFLIAILPLSITMAVNMYAVDPTVKSITDAIGKNLSWTTIRPALFIVAILKFQIFGTQVRIDKPLSYIMTGVGFFFTVVFVETLLPGIGTWTSLGLGLIVAAVALYPIFRWSQRVIARLLPMTSNEENATMLEKRSTYLVSLQTAVVNGVIDTEHDAEALGKQRRALGITTREHELLIDSFYARESSLHARPEVKELFLIHMDGRPLIHERVTLEDDDESDVGKDKDIMAGMLVAIQGYVEEGLKGNSKGRTSLDTVKYGDYSLIIETEDFLVLALVIKGTDNPELRQKMRDQLIMLRKKYAPLLERWDGDLDKTSGAELDLRSFLAEMSLRMKGHTSST